MHQAVRQGNGNHAEEIAEQVLRDYYRFSSPSSLSLSSSLAPPSLAPAFMGSDNVHDYDHDHEHKYNGTIAIDSETTPLLDSQIFSLVLQAWKNSDYASLHSAMRAHNLLIQMAALADQDVLCDPPTSTDYLAVLECWHQASENEDDDNDSAKKSSKTKGSIALIVQHAEELWNQMKERQRREVMTNKTAHSRFSINDKAYYELFASLLAKAGKATQAEQVVREAVLAQQQHERRGPNYSLSEQHTVRNHKHNNEHEHEHEYKPRVSLNLCHAVLRAHLASNETRASERAEAFLSQMMTDPSLPNPSVDSYNLVLERLMASSKATRKKDIDVVVGIAGRVEELIHQMKEKSRIQPNLVSYQHGIDALARSGEAIRAETMLAHLVKDYFLQYDADLKPNITPFQSVLWAYSKAATAKGGRGRNHARGNVHVHVHRRLPDAAERAESILNNMKELSMLLDTHPTVWSYNIVLNCWAHSNSRDAVSRTTALYEELRRSPQVHLQLQQEMKYNNNASDNDNERTNFEQPESEDSTGTSSVCPPADLKPDTTSINTVLNVLSRSNNGACSAVRTEQKLWEFYDAHTQEPKLCPRPDTIAFSTAINAWSNSSDPNSPYRAEALLQKMIDLYDNGNNKNYKPDVVTYTNVVQSWIKSKKREAPEKSESILRELQRMARDGEKSMEPDAACWNSVISAWATAGNGERAEALFLEMIGGSRTVNNYNDGASPTPITLTNVLKAWVKTRSPEASDRAIALLAKMEEYYRDGRLPVKPNVVNYSVVLDCLAYARKRTAAERAESMLKRMEISDDPKMHPSVVSYNSVIKAWSYARDPRSATKITALLRKLIDGSESDPKMRPNEITFGTILKFLADSDLPDKEKRAKAIQNLMNTFLGREPKLWVRNELKKCLSLNKVDNESSSSSSRANANGMYKIQETTQPIASHKKKIMLYETTDTSDERTSKTAMASREKRANKRFNSVLKKTNLVRRPISAKPESSQDFESGCYTGNRFDLCDALVRVRRVGKSTLDTPKNNHAFGNSDDEEKKYSLTFVVVDGDSEYSCKLLNVGEKFTPEIKGGQFLNISYHWYHGELVIVNMKDAVAGFEIPK